MRHLSKLLSTTAIALTLLNSVSFQPDLQPDFQFMGDRSEAKSSSGGRSRGGSFSKPSRSSGSSGSSGGSSSSSSGSSNSRPSRRSYDDDYDSRPYRSRSSGYSSGYRDSSMSAGDWLVLILVLGVVGAIAYVGWKSQQSGGGSSEKTNDIVTITQLQVGLLAQDRDIQDRLSDLTLNADMETPEGRCEMLREIVLSLLRSPENWSHVRSHSQVAKTRDEAGKVFEQLSMTERSKFDAETLVNVGGKVRRQALKNSEDADPGAYIVVTLLVGTEDDKPLFEKVQTTETLQTALQILAGIATEDLLILELLWNPQDSKESLTYDEMLEAYPGLGAIA